MKNKYFTLFITFFKIGLFTFGGGYAMIPLIQKEAVQRYGWLTDDEVLEIIAVAESTPGPIAVNSATFTGFKTAGFWGAFLATAGVVLPSFAVITAISAVLDKFGSLRLVSLAFGGIRAGVLALILKALFSMYRQCPKGAPEYFIMALAFVLCAVLGVNAAIVIVICAVLGIVFARRAER